MLGVLMLDTHFPRPVGDVGHPGSFDMPVRHLRVRGATASRVVQTSRDEALLDPFLQAGHDLVMQGARALTTSCGFLVRYQHALQAALPVPVWTSALPITLQSWSESKTAPECTSSMYSASQS